MNKKQFTTETEQKIITSLLRIMDLDVVDRITQLHKQDPDAALDEMRGYINEIEETLNPKSSP